MEPKTFSAAGFALRVLFAASLVLLTYNPTDYSYFHWLKSAISENRVGALHGFCGVILLIGWTIFVRATLRSLGAVGLLLTFAFFGTLVWLVVDVGIVSAESVNALTWIVLLSLGGVLGVGMSWSHVRRRLSGQADVDEIQEKE